MDKIGVLWKREKDGKVYFSGHMDRKYQIILTPNTPIVLWRNKSENEKAPYYDILIAEDKKQGGNQDEEPF